MVSSSAGAVRRIGTDPQAVEAFYHAPPAPGPAVASDVVIPVILRVAGRELRLFSTITTCGTPVDITLAEVAIESYHPADAGTAAHFEGPGT
ncbi:hypothetical protein [Streptomyces sp. CMB-StM0423]|uniref:hypothetical protein n=1 Tax=Streptomyces sp. CMB-StM0423 TaxID=2059884 RepID=UPI001F32B17F|nr:hypothetical protein [Streptomyces sp. CMB-StM0423]